MQLLLSRKTIVTVPICAAFIILRQDLHAFSQVNATCVCLCVYISVCLSLSLQNGIFRAVGHEAVPQPESVGGKQ